MKIFTAILVLSVFSVPATYAAFYSETENFSSGFTANAALSGGSKGTWSSVNAIVTNNTGIGYSDNWAAYFSDGSSGTNAIGVNNLSSRVWTDFRIKPAFGVEPSEIPADVQTFFFFDADGYIQYRLSNGSWVVATTNIFGASVTPLPLGNADFARVSVFQDYSAGTFAIILNDVVIAQDMPFVNAGTSYQRFTLDNADDEAFLDAIRIYNSLPDGLVGDNNAYVMADATELDTYGYVARTLSVNTNFTDQLPPKYTQISDALAVYRSNDVITVAAGSYAAIVVSNDVALAGSGFTIASITVQDGATLTLDHDVVVSGSITVAAGSTLVASGALEAVNTVIAGTLYIGNNTLTVSGLVDLSASGGNIQIGASGTLDASSIDMASGTQIVSAGGALDNPLLSMSGIFTISGTMWNTGSAISQTLPFTDDFENYGVGTALTNLNMFGWDASDSSVKVTNSVAAAGSQSVILPDGTELSLSISGAGQSRVWTDFYLRPALGAGPEISTAADKGFSSFVDDAGDLNVAIVNEGGTTNWVALRDKARWESGAPVFDVDFTNQFSASAFTRVTVFQDYDKSTFSVFVGTTNLVAVAKPFPGILNNYAAFTAENEGLDAYLDEIRVIATLPFAPGDPTVDINGNGMDDREEIHWFGDLNTWTGIRGSLFRFS